MVVQGPLVVDSFELAQRAAVDGAGVAFMAEPLNRHCSGAGRTRAAAAGWTASFTGFHLCYSTAHPVTPAVRALIDTVCSS